MENGQQVKFETIEPSVWKPELEGDSVEGILIRKETGIGVNESNTYHIENRSGQMMFWGSTVLDSRMSYINIGDYIRVTFKGSKQNQRGQPTKIYKVERKVTNER